MTYLKCVTISVFSFFFLLNTPILIAKDKKNQEQCFNSAKQSIVLNLDRPIKTDGRGNYFPKWIQEYGTTKLSFVEDKDRTHLKDINLNDIKKRDAQL